MNMPSRASCVSWLTAAAADLAVKMWCTFAQLRAWALFAISVPAGDPLGYTRQDVHMSIRGRTGELCDVQPIDRGGRALAHFWSTDPCQSTEGLISILRLAATSTAELSGELRFYGEQPRQIHLRLELWTTEAVWSVLRVDDTYQTDRLTWSAAPETILAPAVGERAISLADALQRLKSAADLPTIIA